jgi:hypothetical protein
MSFVPATGSAFLFVAGRFPIAGILWGFRRLPFGCRLPFFLPGLCLAGCKFLLPILRLRILSGLLKLLVRQTDVLARPFLFGP